MIEIIEHENTGNIVCPHCGVVDEDSWEMEKNIFDGDLGEIDCDSCDKKFSIVRHGEITYSTEKVNPS